MGNNKSKFKNGEGNVAEKLQSNQNNSMKSVESVEILTETVQNETEGRSEESSRQRKTHSEPSVKVQLSRSNKVRNKSVSFGAEIINNSKNQKSINYTKIDFKENILRNLIEESKIKVKNIENLIEAIDNFNKIFSRFPEEYYRFMRKMAHFENLEKSEENIEESKERDFWKINRIGRKREINKGEKYNGIRKETVRDRGRKEMENVGSIQENYEQWGEEEEGRRERSIERGVENKGDRGIGENFDEKIDKSIEIGSRGKRLMKEDRDGGRYKKESGQSNRKKYGEKKENHDKRREIDVGREDRYDGKEGSRGKNENCVRSIVKIIGIEGRGEKCIGKEDHCERRYERKNVRSNQEKCRERCDTKDGKECDGERCKNCGRIEESKEQTFERDENFIKNGKVRYEENENEDTREKRDEEMCDLWMENLRVIARILPRLIEHGAVVQGMALMMTRLEERIEAEGQGRWSLCEKEMKEVNIVCKKNRNLKHN